MRFLIRFLIVVLVLGGVIAAAYGPVMKKVKERNKPKFTTAKVDWGTIKEVVNATGEIKPVLSVSIGSFVSGPIQELRVDFNSKVEKGDILAIVDPQLFESAVASGEASLATRKAEVERSIAVLQQAINDERRANELYQEDPDYISDTELDRLKFNRMSLEAQLKIAHAAVKQADANLDNARSNLAYTTIVAPVAGTVIDRKIDPGQTLASQFQTPELFVIAPGMDKEMHIYASIDETDIGKIIHAKDDNRKVRFTVDAYRDEVFEGLVYQIRISPTELQNVVTYPVVVAAPNPDLKLLPGMTANLTFIIEEKLDVIRIPRSALRFYPTKTELVHQDDRGILEGTKSEEKEFESNSLSADEQIEQTKKRNRRHVWYQDGDFLRAIEVTVGIMENKYAELLEGDLEAGQELVTDVK